MFSRRNFLTLGFSLPILISSLEAAFQDRPALIETTWSSTFEEGTIDGWFSYPPFEDTAYDFTIFPGSYRPRYELQGYVGSGELLYPVDLAPPSKPDQNTYYLLRAYRPNSASPQRIGFSHKLAIYLSEDSEMRFDYWLKLTASPADLWVELAGADGKRYSYRLPEVPREQWQSLRIPVAQFQKTGESPPEHLEIQAITIIAEFARGDAGTLHYFAIDNVRLTGKRRAGFRVLLPETRTYRHWPLAFSQKHFYPGDRLDLKVQSEVEDMVEVSAQLKDFDGRTISEGLSLSGKSKNWSGTGLYHFTQKDRRGPWTLILTGKTKSGAVVQTRVRIWVLDKPQAKRHPRLFFTEADRLKLVKRSRSGRGKAIWQQIEKQATKARTAFVPDDAQIELFPKDYLLQQLSTYFAILRTNARNALLNAWVYSITENEEAGEFARKTLLKMAGWKQWVHPWFQTQGRKIYYPVGITALELSITYDLIYPLLSEQERTQARRGIMKNGVINAFEEYFVDNRMPNHTSNWISHNTAGPLMAILTFYSDFANDEFRENGEPYFSGLAEKFLVHTRATLKPDGSYGEGFGYQNFTMSTAWPTLAALKTAFGAELARSLYFDRGHLFPVYISLHDGKELMDMGDSHSHRGPASNWAWIVQETRDPLLKWFYEQVPGQSWEDFLWLDDSIPAVGPDSLPPSRLFPDKGNVVFRTGWDEEDFVFVYRAGPNFNHTHADQGSFLLWAFGETLVSEAGPSHYYNDPYYWSYFIQSAGHNTVLIDDNPESQEFGDFRNEIAAFQRHARIENAFLSKSVNRVTSQLAKVYRGRLETFTRKIYFVDPGYLVLHDQIRSRSGPHRYHWQLFPPQKEGLIVRGDEAIYKGQKAWLQVWVLAPANPVLKIKDVPVPINDYAKLPEVKLRPRAVLQVTHEAKVENQDFVVVLLPMKAGAQPVEQITEMTGSGFKGARVVFADWQDEFFFANGGKIGGKIVTDGSSAFLRQNRDSTIMLAAEQATSVAVGGETVLQADHPVDMSMTRSDEGELWQIESKTDTRIWLKSQKPGQMYIKGKGRKLAPKGGLQGIALNAGKVEMQINYR